MLCPANQCIVFLYLSIWSRCSRCRSVVGLSSFASLCAEGRALLPGKPTPSPGPSQHCICCRPSGAKNIIANSRRTVFLNVRDCAASLPTSLSPPPKPFHRLPPRLTTLLALVSERRRLLSDDLTAATPRLTSRLTSLCSLQNAAA